MATPSTRALDCRVCSSKLRRKDRFCWYCGTPVAATPSAPAARATAGPTQSASLQVGEQKAYALEEQRKLITILFIDLQGSTPLAESLDPEDLRNVMGGYFAVASRHIQHFGGTIDKYIGDAVMAVFGAPISHEDDAQRAIGAALSIKADMAKENEILQRRYGVQLVLRTGINTGEVVAGMLSGDVQAAYTVTGDAVNTAQRLESAAPPNEVLVSDSTYVLCKNAFVFETMPPLTLKGKSEPVRAHRLVGRERRGSPREVTGLVGRGADLARLHDAFREAIAGNGQTLHLYGEAGVGKTRLLGEFLTGLGSNVTRIRARCSSYEIATPYALVADFIRRAFRIEPTDAEPVARHAVTAGIEPLGLTTAESAIALVLEILGYGALSALDPTNKRRQLLSVLRRFFAYMSEQGPFAITAEDVHWIDPASRALLAEIAPDFAGLHCVFLSTSRDEHAIAPAATLVSLDALDPASASEMMDRVATTPLDESTRALVLERTGGNPFFIEEVVRALASGKAATVPATVQDVLEARFDGLEESPRRVAQRASVIGRSFWLRILARVMPNEPLEPALATLENERFIAARETIPEPTYAFRHALVQEVVYGSQLVAHRRAAHAAVGAAIEEHFQDRVDEFTDQLAFHFDRSDNDERALFWLVRAGDRAKALFANQEAVALYRAALRRASDGEGPLDAGTILERVGGVQALIGRYDEAIDTLRNARRRIPTPRRATLARLSRKIGNALVSKAAYPEALATFEESRRELGSDDDVEAARIGVAVAQLHFRRADYVSAVSTGKAAVKLAQDLGAQDVVAEGLKQVGNATMSMGDLPHALALYARSRQLYEQLEDLAGIAEVRNNIGSIHRRMAKWDDALNEYRVALELRQRIGYVWGLASGNNNIGEVYRSRGEPDQAIPHLRTAIDIWEGIGAAADAAGALMNLGAARVEAGDVAGGRQDVLEAKRRFEAIGKTMWIGLNRYVASAELAAGNLETAEAAAEQALDVAKAANARHFVAMAQRVRAEVAMARGERDLALTLLEESRRTLAELGEIAELGKTEALLARL